MYRNRSNETYWGCFTADLQIVIIISVALVVFSALVKAITEVIKIM